MSQWKVATLSALALVTAFGCSSNSNVFIGTWNFDEEAPFHSAKIEGTLVIEEPCVYVIDDYVWLFPDTPLEELPDPVRIFVNLPQDQTRYDPDTGSIWVHDYGPIASGDRVELVGGGIDPNLPDVCSPNVVRAFNIKSLMLKRCDLWFPPDHWVQSGCNSTVSDSLAGLFDYNGDDFIGFLWEGTLQIEEPCIYVINVDSEYGDDSENIAQKQSEPVRTFLQLPREQTHYDSNTQSIWVHDQGPMASGDRVGLIGGRSNLNPLPKDYDDTSWAVPDYGIPQRFLPPSMCSTNIEYVFTASHMVPKGVCLLIGAQDGPPECANRDTN